MNDIVIPVWIRERQNILALQEAREEADRQRQVADSLRIQKDAPEYCKRLLRELAINTDALPHIKFQGNTASLPSYSGEISCRVSVSIPGSFPRQTYTDVFCRNHQIECSMLNGGVRRYYFCVEDQIVGVLPEIPDGRCVRPIGSDGLAELIVSHMVDYLGKSH